MIAASPERPNSERDDRFSTRDLLGYLLCRHATWRDIQRTIDPGHFERPVVLNDDLRKMRSVLGQKHEQQWVEALRARGITVESLSKKDGVQARQERTAAAMAAGVQAIHGGVLGTETWMGEPDLLIRRDVFERHFGAGEQLAASAAEGSAKHIYEVADIKLMGSLTVPTLLQVAFYAELMAEIQSLTNEEQHAARFHFFLGAIVDEENTPLGPLTLRYADHSALLRDGMRSVELSWDSEGQGLPQVPEPVTFCSRCDWELTCDRIWREQRDISIIAGISLREQRLLRQSGINTVDELVAAFEDENEDLIDAIRNPYRREQLVRQARLQIASLNLPVPLHELRPPNARLFEREDVQRGFQSLPQPALGDLYMDFEDYEFHPSEEGRGQVPRVVLFGVVAGSEPLQSDTGHYVYEAAQHPDDEEQTFKNFLDHLRPLLPAPSSPSDPNAEGDDNRTAIFHFGSAEPSTFRRLVLRYDAGQDLLERIRWVDLRQITVRVATIGVHRYSLKELERLTGFDRSVPLEEIKLPAITYMKFLTATEPEEQRAILENFIGYNQDDCRSLIALRGWLETIRAAYEAIWPAESFVSAPFPTRPPKPEPEGEAEGTIYEQARRRLAELEAQHRVLAVASPEPQRREWHKSVAALLGFRERENRTRWMRQIEMYQASPEKVIEDADAIGGLEAVELGTTGLEAVYSYPEQFIGLESDKEKGRGKGDSVEAFEDGTIFSGRVLWLDQLERKVCIGWTKVSPVAPGFVYEVESPLYPSPELALAAFAELALGGPEAVRPTSRAVLEVPRPGCLVDDPGMADDERAVRSALAMDPGDVLVIQGPPGTGKSYLAGSIVAALAARGERTAVATQSHAAYQIVLEEAERQGLSEHQIRIGGGKHPRFTVASGDKLAAFLRDHHGAVAGGTKWTFSSDEVAGEFDTLIVDEAGQFALVDLVAISRCARKIILLGDPQQLPMVLTAEHPEPADRSAMEHWLHGAGGSPTVPPDYGILLTATRRMHPLTTEFISQAFYEGRLTTQATEQQDQRVVISAPDEDTYTASPLQALFVAHIDDTSYSTAEAALIADVVARLVQYGEVSTHGGPLRKFRNTSKDGDAPHQEPDILIVAPYSAQVRAIEEALAKCIVSHKGLDPRPYAQVMTTDKAQGKTAAVVIYSLVRSSVQGARRGSDFLLSPNRFNVAISRARALSLLVCSWLLPEEIPQSPEHAKNLNPLKLYLEMASHEILGVDPRKDESD